MKKRKNGTLLFLFYDVHKAIQNQNLQVSLHQQIISLLPIACIQHTLQLYWYLFVFLLVLSQNQTTTLQSAVWCERYNRKCTNMMRRKQMPGELSNIFSQFYNCPWFVDCKITNNKDDVISIL